MDFNTKDTNTRPKPTQEQLKEAFVWLCERLKDDRTKEGWLLKLKVGHCLAQNNMWTAHDYWCRAIWGKSERQTKLQRTAYDNDTYQWDLNFLVALSISLENEDLAKQHKYDEPEPINPQNLIDLFTTEV